MAGLLTALSLGLTGLAVGGGILIETAPDAGAAAASLSSSASPYTDPDRLTESRIADREERVSRSADRTAVVSKARDLASTSGPARTRTEDLSSADPRTLARALMPQFGMSTSEFGCLDGIWSQESGWNIHADNPSSSAYGIPQALPGSKMSSAGPEWENNPVTQIKWGLGYIKGRYGSACSAAGFKSSHGWY